MIVGFDVDGVLSKAPLRLERFLGYRAKGWNRLLSTPVGRFFYRNLRYVDKETRKVLCQLRANGHRIVIATYVFRKHRAEVEKWLGKNEVPFDELFLARERESPLEFKVRTILSERCDYFVEDQSILAQGISQEVSGVQVIYYRKKEDLRVLCRNLYTRRKEGEMQEILIHDAGVTPRGMRFLNIRPLFRKGASKLSWEIADTISQELGRLKERGGDYYKFFIDPSSSRQVGVECPPDSYTRRRIIGVVNAVAKSHYIEVKVIAFPKEGGWN